MLTLIFLAAIQEHSAEDEFFQGQAAKLAWSEKLVRATETVALNYIDPRNRPKGESELTLAQARASVPSSKGIYPHGRSRQTARQ